MKKFITILLSALILTTGLISTAPADKTASDGYTVREKKLEHALVQVYDFGSIKLHAFQTGDPMTDECFILETGKNLVGIESPAFKKDIEAWKQYAESLKKPLTDVLLSYHPAGGRWYGTAKSHATEATVKSITQGKTKALIEKLSKTFGPDFDTDVPKIDNVIQSGPNKIGGIDFEIIDRGEGYDIGIPAIRSIYIHMLGADTHSIMGSVDRMNETIKTLEGFKAKQYALILSSHHTPEKQADVDTKIAYLKKAVELAKLAKNKDEFAAAMKGAFPNYKGLNYLDMTAGYLYK